jgi:hypothetical protein
MPGKPLVWMIVVDTALLVVFMLLVIFNVLPQRQVLFVVFPILFVVDALFVGYLVRRSRSGGTPVRTVREDLSNRRSR